VHPHRASWKVCLTTVGTWADTLINPLSASALLVS
jgi:hypothetical protein